MRAKDGVVVGLVLLFLFWRRRPTEVVTATTTTLAFGQDAPDLPGFWVPLGDGTKVWYPNNSTSKVPSDPGMSEWPPT